MAQPDGGNGAAGPGRIVDEAAALANAQVIVELCRERLSFARAETPRGVTLWRKEAGVYELLRVDIYTAESARRPGLHAGSMMLSPNCRMAFLPALGAGTDAELEPAAAQYGSIAMLLQRGVAQPETRHPNVWWPGDDDGPQERILRDILDRIGNEVPDFFRLCADGYALLEGLLKPDNEDLTPTWDVGKTGSLRRLLYTGFAAIDCLEFDLAVETLQRCAHKLQEQPEIGGPDIHQGYQRYIEEGLASARERRVWRSPAAS